MADHRKAALVPALSSALVRSGSEALARRGLRDLEAAGKPKRIFTVDNEETVRKIICAMLTSAGYECREFRGGLDALAALESGERCDLLLTDLLNSPMDGLTLLLRMKEKHPAIPVVMSTAIRDVSVAEACLENGAREYLLLPFARRQLLDVVHYILRDSLPAQRAPLNSRASPSNHAAVS